uniref:Fringe-like glycosyltransferase domain-containing protein n=1 Tax=Anopheles merus TaxID=30066 RepID=A0A182V850_ANOME
MTLLYTATYRYKRALQTMAAGVFLIYMTLVLYQNVYGYDGGDGGPDPDRAIVADNLQDLQSFGAMMLGGGTGAGDEVPPGVPVDPAIDASVVISKRDNSAPYGRADNSENELVRADANKLVTGPGEDPRRRTLDGHRIPPPPAVTGTPKPPTTELDDLLISVKTTKSYHDTRLEMIIKTWYQLAKEQGSGRGINNPQDIGQLCLSKTRRHGPFSTAQTTQSATEPKAPDTTWRAQNQFKMPQEVKQKKKPRRDGVGRDCRKPFDGSLVPKINDAFGVSRRRLANGTVLQGKYSGILTTANNNSLKEDG